MSDIVERLRAVDHGSVEDCFCQSPLFAQAADEIERLRERLGPRGLEVVLIDGRGHYVNEAVKAEIERLRQYQQLKQEG